MVDNEPVKQYEAEQLFGYSHSVIEAAMYFLKASGFVSKIGGTAYATERGKIAVAVWRGKLARLRYDNRVK